MDCKYYALTSSKVRKKQSPRLYFSLNYFKKIKSVKRILLFLIFFNEKALNCWLRVKQTKKSAFLLLTFLLVGIWRRETQNLNCIAPKRWTCVVHYTLTSAAFLPPLTSENKDLSTSSTASPAPKAPVVAGPLYTLWAGRFGTGQLKVALDSNPSASPKFVKIHPSFLDVRL